MKRRVEGEERPEFLQRSAVERLDVRAAAGPGPGDDVGIAVAVDVAGGHAHAAGESGGIGEEVVDDVIVGAAEDLDVRPAAGAGPGNDVGLAVAVDVADGHVDAAGEGRCVCVKLRMTVPVLPS